MPIIVNEIDVSSDANQPSGSSAAQPGAPSSNALPARSGSRQGVALEAQAHLYGVYPALVVGIVDPHAQGCVEISLPWALDAGGSSYRAWARLATLAAGDQRGSWFIPEVGDEVLVVFEAGDPGKPYVIGCLWNGKDSPPASMDGAGQNQIKVLRTRSGLQITLDDSPGSGCLELTTPGGQTVSLQDSSDRIVISAGSSKIIVKDSQIEIESSGKLVIAASTTEINTGLLTVNTGMAKFSGVVQTETLIANSVISASYTPGAGNIW